MSDTVKQVQGNMKLYSGPLGQVLAGTDSNLTLSSHHPSNPTTSKRIFSQMSLTKFNENFSHSKAKSNMVKDQSFEDTRVLKDSKSLMGEWRSGQMVTVFSGKRRSTNHDAVLVTSKYGSSPHGSLLSAGGECKAEFGPACSELSTSFLEQVLEC